MLLRTRKFLICVLAFVCIMLFAVAGITGFTSMTAHAYSTLPTGDNAIGNLYDSASKKFSEANLNALAQKAGYADAKDMIAKAQEGESKDAAAFGETVVKFGKDAASNDELAWIPVYLSRDTDGNAILTLWLATTKSENDSTHNQEIAQWNDTQNNVYSDSTIRQKTLNNGTSATNNGSNKFEMYTTGELASYITVPNKVRWQKNESVYLNDLSNSTSGYSTVWGNDRLWLPSVNEVFLYNSNDGIWKTSNQQMGNNKGTWLRSGHVSHAADRAVVLNSSNGAAYSDIFSTYAVRPALHLNLSSVADTLFDYSVRVMTSTSDTVGRGFLSIKAAWVVATAGNYARVKLFADVTTDTTLEVAAGKDITLDLNGKELKFTGSSGAVIKVTGSGSTDNRTMFTLTDSEKDVPESQKTEHTVNGPKIKGGLITGGKSGGVYVSSGGNFTMEGGAIAGNNTAGNGGGVYVSSGGNFTMNDGTIAYNTASANGGGVYFDNASAASKIFRISGTVKIVGNKKGDAANNVYLSGSTNRIYAGQLYPGAEIYVNNTGAVVTGFTAANNPQNAKPSDIFKSDDSSNNCVYISDESAGVVTIGAHTGGTATCQAKAVCENCNEEYGELNPDNHNYVNGICACGVKAHFEVTVGNGSPVTKDTFAEAWTYASEQSSADTPATIKTLDNVVISEFTSGNGTVAFIVEAGKNIILDLNGYKLALDTTSTNIRLIRVSGTFTLDDSTKNLPGKNTHVILDSVEIKGGLITGATKVGVDIYSGGKFTMEGGTIAGNGGGVYVASGGEFIMNNGAISYNTVTGNVGKGGGVEVMGTFTMNDGIISHNSASRGGGVGDGNGGFTMNGGTIEYNTATDSGYGGGGVYSTASAIYVSGNPKIRNNKTIKDGKEILCNVGFYSSKNRITVSGALKADAEIYIGNGGKSGDAVTGFTAEKRPQNTKVSDIFKSDDSDFYNCIYFGDDSAGIVTVGTHSYYNVDFTVDKEPTCTEDGQKSKHCSHNCGECSEITVIPASHTLTSVAQQDKTCTEDGVLAHDHCSVCGKDFISGVEKSADDLRIPAAGHSLTSVAQADKTCTTDGVLAHDHCSACGKDFIGGVEKSAEELKIPASHTLSSVAQVDKTCTTDGVLAHDHCSVCNKDFINGVEKTADELKIAAGHTLTAVAQVNKTCTTDGTLAHDHCSVCNKDFISGVEKTADELKIAAGHTLTAVAQKDKTCTEDGVLAHDHCTACNKDFINNVEKTAEQLKIAAGHSFGTWINEIAATCSATGTKAHKDCSVCNKHFDNSNAEITDLTIAIDDNAHSWDEGRITTPATCTQAGVKTFTCEHNGAHTRTEAVAIDATAHSFSADWTKDESGHWHAATCGHTTEKSGFAAHTASEWIVDTPAQIGVVGRKHKECTVCHYTLETAEIPAIEPGHEHTFATEWTSDASGHWHAATCEHISQKSGFAAHTAGDWIIDTPAQIGIAGSKHKECTVCGYTVETAEIPAIVHQHTFATEWTKDASGHWHAATCEHTDEKSDFAAHTASDWIVDTPAQIGVVGSKHKECTVCGYTVETAEIPEIEPGHEHTFATEWTKDESGHWHAATCEHISQKGNFAAHTADDWIIDTPAQIGVAGSKHKECAVCGYVMQTEIIEPLTDTLVKPGDNGGENQVVVTTPDGFASDVELVVTEIAKENYGAYESIAQTVNGEINLIYDVTLKSEGVTVQPDGTLTIKLLIPAQLQGKNFKLFHLHGSEATEMEYNVDGSYAVVTTDKLSEFIFVGEKTGAPDTNVGDSSDGVWIALIVIMCVIILGEAGFFVYRYVFKKKRTEGKK